MGFETFNGLMKTISNPKFYKHLEGLIVRAEFSKCGNYRYLMEIKKKNKRKSNKRVCTIMLNPSVANENQADKSVQFLEKLIFEKSDSHFLDIGELTIVNLYAFVQTRNFEGNPELIGPKNNHFLKAAIASADIVLIAWGKSTAHQQRKDWVLGVLGQYPEKEVLITKVHPSRGYYTNFISEYQS